MATGQHIFVKRRGFMVRGIIHHGIDLGDGTVIHFTGPNAKDARVFRTNFKTFANNRDVDVFPYDNICQFARYEFGTDTVSKAIERNYYELGEDVPPPNVQPLLPSDVINQAFRWLGTTFMDNAYYPGKNNCEHFATGCATGYPFSLQAQYAKEFLHNRPSLGGLIAVLFTESQRFFLNPFLSPAKPKDGFYYTGTLYCDKNTGINYKEHYWRIGQMPPKWFIYNTLNKKWQNIDQKTVPYPLSQVVHYYMDKDKRTRKENVTT